jgi:hypothetical protein
MALFANRVVVAGCRRSARDIVRVVARGAAQLAGTLDITLRLPQPVRALRDFKAILHSSGPVERHAEIPQRLAWNVREWRSVKPADGVRKIQARRLEVALHTYLDLPIGRQTLRVENSRPNLLRRRARGSEGDVPLPRPVTSLAIDAFGNGIEKGHLCAAGMFERPGNPGISVVAEHALVVHGANRARKVRLIVPWAHVPIAALFGIPAQRQDLQGSAACEMKISE